MALPRQVRAKIEEVAELEKQLKGEPAVVEEVETQPEPEVPEAEPVAEVPPEPKPEPKPEEPKKSDDTDVWKQKYKTLQGMYDKEVPVLHTQVKDLTKQVGDLKEALAKASETKRQANLVTDEDVKNFGEDLIEVQRKVAREVASQFEDELAELRTANEEMRKLLGSTESKVQQSSFEARLQRLVPDFAEVDADPRWISWLDGVDPVLRAPRRSVAGQAYANGDAEGVAHYVQLFKQTLEPVEPEQNEAKNKELERQIQPSRSASSAAPTATKSKTYTQADINGMFKKLAALNASGQFDKANKLEAEIDSAYSQGRVRG
jgi:hypothetical protein